MEDRINDFTNRGDSMTKNNNELIHFGIMGMKWGVRNNKGTPVAKSRNSEDHITAKILKKKPLNEMSNADLQALTKRLQLEQQYKTLTKQSSSFTKSHDFVKEALAVGTTVASLYALSQTPAFKNIRKVITSKN